MWRATITEAGDGRYSVRFPEDGQELPLQAPDLQAAVTEAQARWPGLDFRPVRPDERLASEVLAVSP